MIEVEHLTKYYGSFLAVDDISFTIEDGHVYGFLGPNGAGKSTTMNIITGCLSATAGAGLLVKALTRSESLAFHKDESWLCDADEAFPAEVDGASVCLVSRTGTMTLVEAVQAIVLGQSTDEA